MPPSFTIKFPWTLKCVLHRQTHLSDRLINQPSSGCFFRIEKYIRPCFTGLKSALRKAYRWLCISDGLTPLNLARRVCHRPLPCNDDINIHFEPGIHEWFHPGEERIPTQQIKISQPWLRHSYAGHRQGFWISSGNSNPFISILHACRQISRIWHLLTIKIINPLYDSTKRPSDE